MAQEHLVMGRVPIMIIMAMAIQAGVVNVSDARNRSQSKVENRLDE